LWDLERLGVAGPAGKAAMMLDVGTEDLPMAEDKRA
jgi:hypothetical protein